MQYVERHEEQAVPVIGLRRKIAQNMQEAKRRIPHFTYVEELDVTELEALRARLNATWGPERGRLTLLPFVMRAIVRAAPAFPEINARFDDDAGTVTRYGAVHVGIATQTEGGLMVPVVRHAEARDLWSCAAEVARLADAARTGKVARDELSGSTITITSLGPLGGIVTTPGHQLSGGGDHRDQPHRRAARDSRGRRGAPVDDEPVVVVRSSRGRRHAGRRVRAGAAWIPRSSSHALHRLMETVSTTLLVIGGGPGGYVAGIRAAQLGVPTTLVEGEFLGGTCLNVGCIPSKAMIHAAGEFAKARQYASGHSALGIQVQSPALDLQQTVRWKDGIVGRLTSGVAALLKKSGAQVVHGWARIVDGKTVDVSTQDGAVRIRCEHLLLAPGSQETALPGMPFGGRVISSTMALSPASLPQRLVVVGAGYIGLELGTAYRKLGAEVTVVEALDRVLPAYDEELVRPVAAGLRRLGIEVHLGCTVHGLTESGDAVRVKRAQAEELLLPADQVLVAIGRRPRTEGWGLESLALDMNGRAIRIDDQCRTSMRNVWAIGDVTGEPMLAHRAMAQGEMVAEIVAGLRRRFEPAAIPAVCFTDPEIVVVGLSPAEAEAAGLDCIRATVPFTANGRALTLEHSDGFVRVVARRDDHLVVGWQAVGAGVSELSAAFAQSIELGARLEDAAGTIHAHPTLGEAVQEAALKALGQPRHV